ncbi:hypothetical protein E2562_035288 [Oryza meyeriana var. granulata]|uniref:Uncharacterized protein n=1 Tax=Oryza meyeriana var. granulata TaxID=110450 RepID=A0A6G1CL35_9ORYZ|nr:hypothetical protein E2562_035288 [Oryza meyeriana var. granulata]
MRLEREIATALLRAWLRSKIEEPSSCLGEAIRRTRVRDLAVGSHSQSQSQGGVAAGHGCRAGSEERSRGWKWGRKAASLGA